MDMIKVAGLVKHYGPHRALDGVDFQVGAGEIVGLLGPNGAGKTTLMKILTGFVQPDEGTVTVAGCNVLRDPAGAQEQLGYLPENAPLYQELTVLASLRLAASLRRIVQPRQDQAIASAVEDLGLTERLAEPVASLSKGFRQRLGLAQAILHRPKVLILDEPTNGLDPTQIVEVRGLIRRLAEHSTILISTHILSEVEASCQRVVILMQGQVRADARLQDLAASSAALLQLTEGRDIADQLIRLPGVTRVTPLATECDGTGQGACLWRVEGTNGVALCPAIFALAAAQSWPVAELRPDSRSLETVFNELAGGERS